MRDASTLQNHARTHAARAIVLGMIRFCAMVMVVVGLVLVLNRVLYGVLGVGEIAAAFNTFVSIGETQGMYLGLPLIAVGLLMGMRSERLARWVVRMPAMGCANCGYSTLGEDGKCSECGYR